MEEGKWLEKSDENSLWHDCFGTCFGTLLLIPGPWATFLLSYLSFDKISIRIGALLFKITETLRQRRKRTPR